MCLCWEGGCICLYFTELSRAIVRSVFWCRRDVASFILAKEGYQPADWFLRQRWGMTRIGTSLLGMARRYAWDMSSFELCWLQLQRVWVQVWSSFQSIIATLNHILSIEMKW